LPHVRQEVQLDKVSDKLSNVVKIMMSSLCDYLRDFYKSDSYCRDEQDCVLLDVTCVF
jgi:hypothetical protein